MTTMARQARAGRARRCSTRGYFNSQPHENSQPHGPDGKLELAGKLKLAGKLVELVRHREQR